MVMNFRLHARDYEVLTRHSEALIQNESTYWKLLQKISYGQTQTATPLHINKA